MVLRIPWLLRVLTVLWVVDEVPLVLVEVGGCGGVVHKVVGGALGCDVLVLAAEGVPQVEGSVAQLMGYGAAYLLLGVARLGEDEAILAVYGHVALFFFCLTKRSKTQAQINALPALPALAKFLYKRVPNHVCGIYARLAFTPAHPRRIWAGPRTRVLQTR